MDDLTKTEPDKFVYTDAAGNLVDESDPARAIKLSERDAKARGLLDVENKAVSGPPENKAQGVTAAPSRPDVVEPMILGRPEVAAGEESESAPARRGRPKKTEEGDTEPAPAEGGPAPS